MSLARPTHAQWAARELLADLCRDLALQAAVVRDLGGSAAPPHTDELNHLIDQARRLEESLQFSDAAATAERDAVHTLGARSHVEELENAGKGERGIVGRTP